MRWITFILFAYGFLAVQIGFGDLLEINEIRPDWLFILAVFIAAMAPTSEALWSAVILGLLADLTASYPTTSHADLTIVGAHALGYALGASLTLQLRTMLFRQHPVSLTLMVFLSALAANLMTVFLVSLRWLFGDWFALWTAFQWSPTEELVDRFLMVLYTSALTLPVTWALIRLSPLFSFEIHPRYLHVWHR